MPKPEGKSFAIPKQLVWEAWRRVKDNKGAPGVDGQDLEEFEADLGGNLYKIWNRMSSGTWSERLRAAVDERAAGLGNVSAQVHVACVRGRAGRSSHRASARRRWRRRTVEGVDHHPCIFGRASVDVLACQLWRNHAVAARFELGGQGVPRPGAVPGAVHQRAPHVRLPIIDPIFLESLWAVQRRPSGVSKHVTRARTQRLARVRAPQCALAASAADSPARSSCSMFLIVVSA